jgi:hypothetical protein
VIANLLIGAAGGIIAGAILLSVEYLLRHRERKRDRAEQRLVRFVNQERRVTETIFNYLGPGSSIELMKSELGPPNRTVKEPTGLFRDDMSDNGINSYVYLFKNALVKIASKDGKTINNLTVLANDTDIAFNNLFFVNPDAEPQYLAVATLTREMLEDCRVEDFEGCRDAFAAAQKAVDNPFYVHITYFCESPGKGDISKNPELLVGSVIHGICLSAEAETANYVFAPDVLYGR